MSSTVATEKPIPAFLVAHLLSPTDLATFANVSRHVHGELRGFPLDLIYNHAEYYTEERLSALLIQPGYWKLTAVMIQARDWNPPSPPPVPSEAVPLQFHKLGHSGGPGTTWGALYLPGMRSSPVETPGVPRERGD
jgi:hypothetical protein